jgi:hypothetical protein
MKYALKDAKLIFHIGEPGGYQLSFAQTVVAVTFGNLAVNLKLSSYPQL